MASETTFSSHAHPVTLELFKHRFSSIAEEMGQTLQRTAFSANIKERRDFSCAVFDYQGDLVAQAAHIPVHLGSLPLSVKSAIEGCLPGDPMAEGDMVMINDPFGGGTHLPDITLVAPVFVDGRLLFYVANRAHHADIGGMSAGSMPVAETIFQEGLILPPTKLVRTGQIVPDLQRLILANVRTPAERQGDFEAQIMANLTGCGRLIDLCRRYGAGPSAGYARALMDHSETVMKQTITEIPDGTCAFADVIEDDGRGNTDITIKVRIRISGDRALVDFSGSSAQVPGSVNAVRAVTLSAVLYVFRSLVHRDIVPNAGCLRPLTVITSPGTIVDARSPAAVAGGNVETAQRIVDVLLGALAQALPETVPAASQGTMNNLTIGGMDPRRGQPFTYYETIGGGMGASADGPGESAIHSHMTNTWNTPAEALEFSYPLRVRACTVRKNSGGGGRFPGGDGIVRELELLADSDLTVLSERRRCAPWGSNHGQPGRCGRNAVRKDGRWQTMPGKFSARLKAGDRVRIETPGGGGWGKPQP